MDKLFPRMYDCPESKQIAMGGLYWVVYIVFLPFLLLLACAGGAADNAAVYTCILAYFLINGIIVFLIFREYLIDSLWNVRLNKKHCFASVGLGVLVFFSIEAIMIFCGLYNYDMITVLPFPAADSLFGVRGVVLVMGKPILMTLCLITIVPITMCCLYYAVGFASVCQNRMWLGYLVVALISAIPAVLQVTSMDVEIIDALRYYVGMLPFHVCACWVYQRSDTIWGPILFHTVTNLLSVPIAIFLFFADMGDIVRQMIK